MALRKSLWRMGYRYRVQSARLTGRPDIVLPKYRCVVFVDGDYWHGRALREGGDFQLRQVIRGPRFHWWRDKLARNITRDEEVTVHLRAEGWRVIRIWESEVIADLPGVTRRVAAAISARRSAEHGGATVGERKGR